MKIKIFDNRNYDYKANKLEDAVNAFLQTVSNVVQISTVYNPTSGLIITVLYQEEVGYRDNAK